MKLTIVPTWSELEAYKTIIPEIDPSAVLTMLELMNAAETIRTAVHDVLERQFHVSEGKLRTLIVLHQHSEGLTPSELAEKTSVTKATISVMTGRMIRDGLVEEHADPTDKRSKLFTLTETGRSRLHAILPAHYLRISQQLNRLSKAEQHELIGLLQKLSQT